MTIQKFRRSGPIVLTVLLLVVAVPGYLVVDGQIAVARGELGQLQSRFERSDRLLKVSASLAPGGDADLAGLDQAIERLQRDVDAGRKSFLDPTHAEADLERVLSEARAADVAITELRPLGSVERDFDVEHRYSVVLSGAKSDVRSTLQNFDQGRLLVSWTQLASREQTANEVVLDASFSVYSLTGVDGTPAAQVFPACEAEQQSSVWEPWLADSVEELAQRVATLCARANETPARTARIMSLEQLNAMKRSAEVVSKNLRDRRVTLDSVTSQ